MGRSFTQCYRKSSKSYVVIHDFFSLSILAWISLFYFEDIIVLNPWNELRMKGGFHMVDGFDGVWRYLIRASLNLARWQTAYMPCFFMMLGMATVQLSHDSQFPIGLGCLSVFGCHFCGCLYWQHICVGNTVVNPIMIIKQYEIYDLCG